MSQLGFHLFMIFFSLSLSLSLSLFSLHFFFYRSLICEDIVKIGGYVVPCMVPPRCLRGGGNSDEEYCMWSASPSREIKIPLAQLPEEIMPSPYSLNRL